MPATDYDMDKVEQQYAVNVFGPIRLVREFGREIIAAKGTIVNIGSIAGVQPWPYSGVFSAELYIYQAQSSDAENFL